MQRGKTDWMEGIQIFGDFSEVDCSGCDERYRFDYSYHRERTPKAAPVIKFFAESHGYLCPSCFREAPLCACGELAIVQPENKCRECFMGEEVPRKYEELVYKSNRELDLFAPAGEKDMEE